MRHYYCTYTISGTYKTQELPSGIRVAANQWPVKMAINITSSSWPLSWLSPWGPQGAKAVWRGPWYLIFPCSASCMPHQHLQWLWLTTDQWQKYKLHPCRHCLHTKTWIRILNYFLIFICKHSQHTRHPCHVHMACNPWLETWDVAIIHTGGTRICVTVQWITVDHMTLSPAELNLIWTAAVNSRAMTGESQTQSRTIANVHPLHYFATNTDRFSE